MDVHKIVLSICIITVSTANGIGVIFPLFLVLLHNNVKRARRKGKMVLLFTSNDIRVSPNHPSTLSICSPVLEALALPQ